MGFPGMVREGKGRDGGKGREEKGMEGVGKNGGIGGERKGCAGKERNGGHEGRQTETTGKEREENKIKRKERNEREGERNKWAMGHK